MRNSKMAALVISVVAIASVAAYGAYSINSGMFVAPTQEVQVSNYSAANNTLNPQITLLNNNVTSLGNVTNGSSYNTGNPQISSMNNNVTSLGNVTNPSIYSNTSPSYLNSSRIIISSGAGSEGPNGVCVTNHNCYNPSVMNIKMGAQVTWMNSDSVTHTVTSGKSTDSKTGTLFDQTVSPGKSVSITINNSGTINYFCKIHPWITGQLIVVTNPSMNPQISSMNNNVTSLGNVTSGSSYNTGITK